MLDDFFIRAVIGGVGVALIAGPLGCFIIWRRLAYFGDTLSHSALLGVALALLLELNITVTVFIISVGVAMLLLLLKRQARLSSDALLGLLAHATLAVGLVVLAFMTWVRVDLMGFLFGDILAINRTDIIVIWGGGLAVLVALVSLGSTGFSADFSEGRQEKSREGRRVALFRRCKGRDCKHRGPLSRVAERHEQGHWHWGLQR